MASAELQTVLDMLKAVPVLQGNTVHEMRASMEAMTASAPPPEAATCEPTDAGGGPAEWVTADEAASSDRAIVYLHGGGYCLGSLNSHRNLAANLSRAARARVLNVDYRLAPEHPHPAAIDDAVAAYGHALDQGLAPEKLAVGGDSAGGGLTVATLVALRNAGKPLPAAGICISPWVDLTLSGESMQTKAGLDPIVTEASLRMMADAYAPGPAAKSPGASPLFDDLEGLPPLLVHVGSAEVLLDDARSLVERAEKAGVDVEFDVWEDLFHVWHAFAGLLPEAQQAIDKIGAYLDRRWRATEAVARSSPKR